MVLVLVDLGQFGILMSKENDSQVTYKSNAFALRENRYLCLPLGAVLNKI